MLVAALPFYMHGSSAECNTLDVNINKIQTDKVRYDPSADAVISIDVKNNSNEKISKKLNLDIWGHIDVVLSQNSKNSWSNQDVVRLNYRLTSGNEAWLLGDFE